MHIFFLFIPFFGNIFLKASMLYYKFTYNSVNFRTFALRKILYIKDNEKRKITRNAIPIIHIADVYVYFI